MQQAFDVHFWLLKAVNDAGRQLCSGNECLSRCAGRSFYAGYAVKPWASSTASVGCPGVDTTMLGGVLQACVQLSLRRYVISKYTTTEVVAQLLDISLEESSICCFGSALGGGLLH